MPIPSRTEPPNPLQPPPENARDGVRTAAGLFGLALVVFGSALAVAIFLQVYNAISDPRGVEAQVDRWEFVVRGRTGDHVIADPEKATRTPSGRNSGSADIGTGDTSNRQHTNEVEAMADLAGRVGAKSARVGGLMVILMLLAILVRISVGLIDAGARLVSHAGGEKELLQRLVREITSRKGQ